MKKREPVWEDLAEDIYYGITSGKIPPQYGEEAFFFHRNSIEFQGRWSYEMGEPSICFTGWAVLHTKKLQKIYQQTDSPYTLAHREDSNHPYVCLQEYNGYHKLRFDTDRLRGWNRYEVLLSHLKELSYQEFLKEAHENIEAILKGLVVRGELDQESLDWRPTDDDPENNIWNTIDQPKAIRQETLEGILDALSPSYQEFTTDEVQQIKKALLPNVSEDQMEDYEEYGAVFVGDVRYAAAVSRSDKGKEPDLILMPSYAKGRQDPFDSMQLSDRGDLSLHIPASFVRDASYPAIKKRIETELRESFRKTHQENNGILPADTMHLLMLMHQPTGFWERLYTSYEQAPIDTLATCTLPKSPKTEADRLGEKLLKDLPQRGKRVQLVFSQHSSYHMDRATSDILAESFYEAGWDVHLAKDYHRMELTHGTSYLESAISPDDRHLMLTGAVTQDDLELLIDRLHGDRAHSFYKLQGVLHLGKATLLTKKQWETTCLMHPDVLDVALTQGIQENPLHPTKVPALRVPDQYEDTEKGKERVQLALLRRLLEHERDGNIQKDPQGHYHLCHTIQKQVTR